MSQVYKAVYSGISVYELYVRGSPVMKRCSDSFLNATQILKAAGFPKTKRTKILEREIMYIQHEKVQGGYGKYQGTWIPLEMGRQMAKKYGLEKSLLPLLEHGKNVQPLMIQTPPPTPQKITTSDLTIVKKSKAFTSLEGLLIRMPNNCPSINVTERQEAILKIIFLEGDETELLHLLKREHTLDLEFPLDQEENTALHWAASLGRLHLVQILLMHGADLNCQNAKKETPLQRLLGYECCFQNGTFEDMLTLFESCLFYQNDQKQSILHTLATQSHASTPHYLKSILSRTQDLEHEFFVNGQDDAGDTPLHLAYRYNHESVIHVLQDFGARHDICNQVGRYPSESASFSMFDSGFFDLKKEEFPKATFNDLIQAANLLMTSESCFI